MNDNYTGTGPIEIDKVRASKAGHAFHEAWAARTALELLPPSTDLEACGGITCVVIDNGFAGVVAPQIAPSPAPAKDVRF
jgi:hypothetical protein